ncbi:MAG: peptidase S24 [Candidatus Competibacteraceae bacterium]|nr:peptidase S24 [Candidatus Competibacteraceae bacterium]
MAAVAERSPARAHRPRVDPAPFTDWPLLALPIPAGSPVPADDRIERRLSLDHHLARIPEATFLVRVIGDALAEAGIRDGDLVVMDRAIPATEGSVVLALIEGAFLLAQVGGDAHGQRVLRATAPDHSDRPLEEAVTVGVARWAIHRLWPGRAAPH